MQWAWTWILRTKAVVAEVCTVWERSGRHYFTRRHLLNRRSEVSSLCKTMFKTAWFTGKCDPARLKMFKLRCGRGSVLLFQHFNTLCTSGFVDDVITGQAKANGEKRLPRVTYQGAPLTRGGVWCLRSPICCLRICCSTSNADNKIDRLLKSKVKVAHSTRLPNVWFRSWSRFLAVSLQVTWVINPAVDCHYFPPGPQ